ncbi:hypothetical protein CDN99_18230 [Roseateles aquatilis]|uniref:DUF1640 domain-containing protein n=1 Tax=Roseateles aquatilis TaxID=431061 RepID=A0A246J4M1_9BURK|nr:hypothetical protein [Roseateles aquatilis]OWQ87538.1 hypothetical protein CDN99_18230 [Roseateles aquatilis]
MQMKMFLALTAVGVSDDRARQAAEAVRDDIQERIEASRKNFVTPADLEAVKASLISKLDAHLRWTVSTILSTFGLLAALMAFITFLA